MIKKFEKDSIIEIEGGFAVVDKEAPINIGEYYLNLKDNILHKAEGNLTEAGNSMFNRIKVIATIGIRIEGVPLIELPKELKDGYLVTGRGEKGEYFIESEKEVFIKDKNNQVWARNKENAFKSLQKIPVNIELEYEELGFQGNGELLPKEVNKLKITNKETNTITPINIKYIP